MTRRPALPWRAPRRNLRQIPDERIRHDPPAIPARSGMTGKTDIRPTRKPTTFATFPGPTV